MRERIKHILKEETQPEGIDKKLLNFLMRRIKVTERDLGGNWGDIKPLKVKEYKFEGYPGYGFTSYESKKNMERKIVEFLYEHDITDYLYQMDERDPKRITIIKTIRYFLNHILNS
jgi:hypothetical protein